MKLTNVYTVINIGVLNKYILTVQKRDVISVFMKFRSSEQIVEKSISFHVVCKCFRGFLYLDQHSLFSESGKIVITPFYFVGSVDKINSPRGLR